jgi:hypothetical protein
VTAPLDVAHLKDPPQQLLMNVNIFAVVNVVVQIHLLLAVAQRSLHGWSKLHNSLFVNFNHK